MNLGPYRFTSQEQVCPPWKEGGPHPSPGAPRVVASAALEGLLAPCPETPESCGDGVEAPTVCRPPALRLYLLLCRAGDSGIPVQQLRAAPIFASGSGRSRRAKPGLRCDGVTHPRWSLSPVMSARPCDSSGWGQCGAEPGGRLSRGWHPGCGGRGHSPCPAPPRCVPTPPRRGTLTTALQSCVPSPSEPGSFP